MGDGGIDNTAVSPGGRERPRRDITRTMGIQGPVAPNVEGSTQMSFVLLILWWLLATTLGIAAIVTLEPLWRRRSECAVRTSRNAPGRRARSSDGGSPLA